MTVSTQTIRIVLQLLSLVHYVNAQHYVDDFFLPITPEPSKFPSSRPSISIHPSSTPMAAPSNTPSFQPTNQPTYPLQQFQFSVEIEFDELQVKLSKQSQGVLEEAMGQLLKKGLDQNVHDFFVEAVITQAELIAQSDTKRNLLLYTRRRNQDTSPGMNIVMNLIASVRSETTFDVSMLIERMKATLDEEQETEAFILDLQYSDDTFSPINSIVKFVINVDNQEIDLSTEEKKKDLIPIIYVASGLFLCAILLLILALCIRKRVRERNVNHLKASYTTHPHNQFPIEMSTVDVEQDSDEVSALDMRHCTSPHGKGPSFMFSPAIPKFSSMRSLTGNSKMNESHISLDYDYKKVYQNIENNTSTFSVSSHSETECIDNSTRNYNSSTRRGNTKLDISQVSGVEQSENSFMDDQSFEAMYMGCHSARNLNSSF